MIREVVVFMIGTILGASLVYYFGSTAGKVVSQSVVEKMESTEREPKDCPAPVLAANKGANSKEPSEAVLPKKTKNFTYRLSAKEFAKALKKAESSWQPLVEKYSKIEIPQGEVVEEEETEHGQYVKEKTTSGDIIRRYYSKEGELEREKWVNPKGEELVRGYFKDGRIAGVALSGPDDQPEFSIMESSSGDFVQKSFKDSKGNLLSVMIQNGAV